MHLRLIKTGKYLSLLFLTVILLSCNKESASNTPSQVFYYDFIGFETWGDKTASFNEIITEFKRFDYIINKQEVLLPMQKNQSISIDSLNDYHRLIHKIELFSANTKYSQGEIKITISFLPQTSISAASFQYSQFVYSKTDGWQLKYNLGKHFLTGLPNNKEKRIRFLATEIARASFK